MWQRRRTIWLGRTLHRKNVHLDTAHIFWMGVAIWVEKKLMLGGGDTTHNLLMRETISVGTLHNILRTR